MKPYDYEALDQHGSPYIRPARIISELPWVQRKAALTNALPQIGKIVDLEPKQHLSFGLPVYKAFGLNAKEARKHPQASLLKLSGANISLDLVPGYGSLAE